MELFLGTLIILLACCLVMSLGLIFGGKPLAGGCGRYLSGCAGCDARPNEAVKNECPRHAVQGKGRS